MLMAFLLHQLFVHESKLAIIFAIVTFKFIPSLSGNVVFLDETSCAILYHSYKLKNVKNAHEGVLLR